MVSEPGLAHPALRCQRSGSCADCQRTGFRFVREGRTDDMQRTKRCFALILAVVLASPLARLGDYEGQESVGVDQDTFVSDICPATELDVAAKGDDT